MVKYRRLTKKSYGKRSRSRSRPRSRRAKSNRNRRRQRGRTRRRLAKSPGRLRKTLRRALLGDETRSIRSALFGCAQSQGNESPAEKDLCALISELALLDNIIIEKRANYRIMTRETLPEETNAAKARWETAEQSHKTIPTKNSKRLAKILLKSYESKIEKEKRIKSELGSELKSLLNQRKALNTVIAQKRAELEATMNEQMASVQAANFSLPNANLVVTDDELAALDDLQTRYDALRQG